MSSLWVIIGILVVVAAFLLLRGPVREWRARRAQSRQENKRQWRRERDEAKARHKAEHAMSRQKAAARDGAPTWHKVARIHGSKCWLCGTRTYDDDMVRKSSGSFAYGATYPVVDYVTPIERGGTYLDDNVRIAHRHCASVRAQHPDRGKYGTPPRTYGASSR